MFLIGFAKRRRESDHDSEDDGLAGRPMLFLIEIVMKQALMHMERPEQASFSAFLKRCQEEEEDAEEQGGHQNHHHTHGASNGVEQERSSNNKRSSWLSLHPPHAASHHESEPPSQYMTLIPLSDDRLKPRPWLWILLGTIFVTCVGMGYIYFTVSRGVSIGNIQVVDSSISFETAAGSYHILLMTHLPVFNLNYQEVTVQGTITVSFYDQVAGIYTLEPVLIPRRSQPFNIRADINSSSLPAKWIFTVYSQCHVFPSQLIFFLKSEISAMYLRTTLSLPTIEGYAIVDCKESKERTQDVNRSAALRLGEGSEC
jgi:hypothetical protein